jgi:hypothetical protein
LSDIKRRRHKQATIWRIPAPSSPWPVPPAITAQLALRDALIGLFFARLLLGFGLRLPSTNLMFNGNAHKDLAHFAFAQ